MSSEKRIRRALLSVTDKNGLVDFAQVAGGHNFRPKRESRLKYRYYHQHRGFVEAYDEPKCVGCGRCARACLAGINPTDIIRELLNEEQP